MPSVSQIWSELCKIIRATNAAMLYFLKLFGVVEGNGVSPFVRTFESTNSLITSINRCFMPPASDPCDGSNEGGEDEQPDSDEEGEEASPPTSTSAILTAFLEERLEEMIGLDDNNEGETKSDKGESSYYDLVELSARVELYESFFDDGDADLSLTMLRHVLSQTSIVDVQCMLKS